MKSLAGRHLKLDEILGWLSFKSGWNSWLARMHQINLLPRCMLWQLGHILCEITQSKRIPCVIRSLPQVFVSERSFLGHSTSIFLKNIIHINSNAPFDESQIRTFQILLWQQLQIQIQIQTQIQIQILGSQIRTSQILPWQQLNVQ